MSGNIVSIHKRNWRRQKYAHKVLIEMWVSRENMRKQSLDSKLTAKLDPCAGQMRSCRRRIREMTSTNVAVASRSIVTLKQV